MYSALTFYYDRPRGEMLVPTEAVEVRASTIPNAGLGLFAARDLRAGQVRSDSLRPFSPHALLYVTTGYMNSQINNANIAFAALRSPCYQLRCDF